MTLEDELKDALRRVEPPDGFAERVMRAIELPSAAPVRKRVWWRYAAAAALLVAIGGGTTARYIEQRREGARAKQQLLLALRITSEKLRDTRQHVRAIER